MNKYIRGGLIAAGIALASLYSPGCKSRDEPVVVHPRVGCSHRDCDNDSHSIRINYVKPSHDLEPKYGNRTRPELSRHNPFDEAGRPRVGTQYVIQLPPGYRAVTVVPGGPVITTRFRTVEGGAKPPKPTGTPATNSGRGSDQLLPNPHTGCPSCAESDSSESDMPSLEQRVREAEELIRNLETQLGDSMNPDDDHGRG